MGASRSYIIPVTEAVPLLPALSSPLKEIVYVVPLTNVGGLDKVFPLPLVRSVALRFTV